jgi:hypothetical protein
MFFRKLANRNGFIGLMIAAFIFSLLPEAIAAPIILNSSLGSGCNTTFNNGYYESNRYIAKSNITITAINYLVGTQSTSNFSTSLIHVFSDSATANYPNAILGTFSPDVASGSGSSKVLRFTGSLTVSAGAKFWIVPSIKPDLLPWCYWPLVNTSAMTLNGIVPDTSTSGANDSFRKVYSNSATLPISSTWQFTGDAQQIWQLSIEGNITYPPVVATISLQGSPSSVTFKSTTQINVSVDSPSRVTFYANGKVIAGCRNILSSGGTSICNWKPTLHGSNRIYASANPVSSSYTSSNSSVINVGVAARTNIR